MVNLKLALLRVMRRGSRLGIVIAFLALIQATLVITYAALPTVEAQAVSQKVASLGTSDRWLTVNMGDPSKLGNASLAEVARKELGELGALSVTEQLTYRPISDKSSGRFQLVAANNLVDQIELSTGRLPENCSTTLCEVVVVNGSGLSALPANFVVVGAGTVNSDSPILSTVEPGITLLISSDLNTISKLPDYIGFPGTQLWSSEITVEQIQDIGLAEFIARANQAANDLQVADSRLQLIAPLTALEQTRIQIQILFKRVLSLELSLCLIGSFAIFLFTYAARTSHLLFGKSAKRMQPNSVSPQRISFYVSLIVSSIGISTGLILGWLLSLVGNSNLSLANLSPVIVVLFLSSFSLLFAGLSESKIVQSIGLAIAAGLWMKFIFDQDLQLQVSLIAVGCALGSFAILQVLMPLIRNRFMKNIFLSEQLWIRAICVTTAFLTSAIFFGSSYLASLERNAYDNAVFKSPTLTRITMGGEARPMQNNGFADYVDLSGAPEVFPVRKITTTFKQDAFNTLPTLLVGVDSRVWNIVPDVTNQTKFDLTTSGKMLDDSKQDLGIDVAGVANISLTGNGLNENAHLSAWILNDRFESVQVELAQDIDKFTGQLPGNAQNLIGFQITEDPDFKSRREHAVNEGKNSLVVPTGTISIVDLQFDGQVVSTDLDISSDYSLINGPKYFSYVSAPQAIKAITDPGTAASATENELQLKLGGVTNVVVQHVATADLLPTVPMRFALVDDDALTTLLASTNPEMLRVAEIWIDSQLAKSTLGSDALYGLTIYDQESLLRENFSPSNALWSKRAIQLLTLSSAALFVLMLSYSTRQIAANRQIFGWRASGLRRVKLNRSLNLVTVAATFIGLIGAILVSRILLPIYIEKYSFDINANPAYPPIVITWDVANLIAVVIGLVVSSLLAIGFNIRAVLKSSGVAK